MVQPEIERCSNNFSETVIGYYAFSLVSSRSCDKMMRMAEERKICLGCDSSILLVAFRANPRWGELGEQSRCWECRHKDNYRLKYERAKYGQEARHMITVLAYDPCSYCGQITFSNSPDHIDPSCSTGDSSCGNLTSACSDCNGEKRDRFLLEHLLNTDLHVIARYNPRPLVCMRGETIDLISSTQLAA
jgi:hypothetical protein